MNQRNALLRPLASLLVVLGVFFGIVRLGLASDRIAAFAAGGDAGWYLQGISVKDRPFYAKGDGMTDDTTAIQNAINSTIGKGGIVYFPQGNYIVSGPIFIPPGQYGDGGRSSGLLLEGAGGNDATTSMGTYINFTGTGSCGITAKNCPGFIMNNVEELTIENMGLWTDTHSGPAINLQGHSSFLRLNTVVIGNYNSAQGNIVTTDNNGFENGYFTNCIIWQCSGGTVPAVGLVGSPSLPVNNITMEHMLMNGTGNAPQYATAPLLHIEGNGAYGGGGAGNIALRAMRMEAPIAGAIELLSVRNVIIDDLQEGDLPDGVNVNHPVIHIGESPARDGGAPSQLIQISGSFINDGCVLGYPGCAATEPSILVDSAAGQGGVLITTTYAPFVDNGGPGGNRIVALSSNIAVPVGDPILQADSTGNVRGLVGLSGTNTAAQNLRGNFCAHGVSPQFVGFPFVEPDSDYYLVTSPTSAWDAGGVVVPTNTSIAGISKAANGFFVFYNPPLAAPFPCYDWVLVR
jgi:hypothetical protein